MSLRPLTRVCVALFGAYLCACAVEVLLHESGHGIAALLLGADIDRFDVHPFRRSEVAISYDGGRRAESSLLFSAAGIAFAVAVSGVAYAAARRRSHFLLPVQFLFPATLLAEGQYLIDGSLTNYGDPSAIASLAYLPPAVLVILGAVMVCAGALLVVRLMAYVGLDKRVAWWARSAGFLALAVTNLPGAVYSAQAQDSLREVLTVAFVGLLCMFVFALLAGGFVHFLRRWLSWLLTEDGPGVSWANAASAVFAGAIVAGVMLGLSTHAAEPSGAAERGHGSLPVVASTVPAG